MKDNSRRGGREEPEPPKRKKKSEGQKSHELCVCKEKREILVEIPSDIEALSRLIRRAEPTRGWSGCLLILRVLFP